MHLSLLLNILKIKFILKAGAFKSGALIGISLPLTFGYMKIWNTLFKGVPEYDLVLAVSAIVFCFVLYIVFWLVDFVSGLIASKHLAKGKEDWVESSKLYSSFGKFGAIALVDSSLLALTLFLLVAKLDTTSKFVLFVSVFINFLAMLFEFHSIGENVFKKTGKKPELFTFFERLAVLLEKILFSRISKFFGSSSSVNVIDHEDIKPEQKK